MKRRRGPGLKSTMPCVLRCLASLARTRELTAFDRCIDYVYPWSVHSPRAQVHLSHPHMAARQDLKGPVKDSIQRLLFKACFLRRGKRRHLSLPARTCRNAKSTLPAAPARADHRAGGHHLGFSRGQRPAAPETVRVGRAWQAQAGPLCKPALTACSPEHAHLHLHGTVCCRPLTASNLLCMRPFDLR